MHDQALEDALRFELRAENIRWQPSYQCLPDEQRRELYEKMRDRREQKRELEEQIERKRASPEPEDSLPVVHDREFVGAGLTFNKGTGGGRRVIRSTRHLGG